MIRPILSPWASGHRCKITEFLPITAGVCPGSVKPFKSGCSLLGPETYVRSVKPFPEHFVLSKTITTATVAEQMSDRRCSGA